MFGECRRRTTGAATGNPNVKALVYVDAYIPQAGDTLESLTGAQPGSTLDPTSSVVPVPIRNASGQVVNADVYVKPAQFPAIFAGGISPQKAAVLAAGQRPLAASALSEAFVGVPAWKTIPSWDLIGTADKLLDWPTAAARYREEWLPSAEWVTLDGVGHCPQVEQASVVNELLLEFLANAGPTS